MFNGHQLNGSTNSLYYNSSVSSNNDISVASLYNLGNTCFLNSVIYTLRYCPGFISRIHHLVNDLQQINNILYQNKHKSSSLGRNIPSINGSSSRSSSSKDLLSLGSTRNDVQKADFQVVTEELHDLYVAMHQIEVKYSSDPYRPSSFIQAFVERNKLFEGNRQQDAHEFLICLLSSIRDTCQLMSKRAKELSLRHTKGTTKLPEKSSSKETKTWTVFKKQKHSSKDDLVDAAIENTTNNLIRHSSACNFISEDFEGVSLLRTKCMECECVTERKEILYDIYVPISTDSESARSDLNPDDVFKDACVTRECLSGQNKYYCEECFRYNEALREVCYEKLPRILVFQLKRFMSSENGTEKLKYYMPTPLTLSCFCVECCQREKGQKSHSYSLFSVIMHRGATIAEGHYVSFVRDYNYYLDFLNCEHEKDSLSLSGIMTNEKNSNKKLTTLFKSKSSSSSDEGYGENSLHSLKNGGNNQHALKNGGNNQHALKNGGNILSNTPVCRSLQCCAVNNSSQRSHSLNKSTKDMWLECNDDVIRCFSSREFETILADRKKVSSTPYLLFYVRTS